ncbi:hypothetical protein EVJ58_g8848, partial [Rhodofomes roseus]
GHIIDSHLNFNGKTGELLHRHVKEGIVVTRPQLRTQRTKLQSALLAHVPRGVIELSKKLAGMVDKGIGGVELLFSDGTVATADLVVGADGIRSVVRDTAWPDYEIKFTGTTFWRTLLPWDDVVKRDPRFAQTGWWHGLTTNIWLSSVGEGLGEIIAGNRQDPAVHSADKVSWGVPVDNAYVESHFEEFLPQIRGVLHGVKEGDWREFSAFAGPELSKLTAWDEKVVLVGDASHALSGAFGAGAGFAMEDGWVLAQALQYYRNDVHRALPLFNRIRLPYYARMYAHLENEAAQRAAKLKDLGDSPSYDDRVRLRVIKAGGKDMSWIYGNHIGKVWEEAISTLDEQNSTADIASSYNTSTP